MDVGELEVEVVGLVESRGRGVRGLLRGSIEELVGLDLEALARWVEE